MTWVVRDMGRLMREKSDFFSCCMNQERGKDKHSLGVRVAEADCSPLTSTPRPLVEILSTHPAPI